MSWPELQTFVARDDFRQRLRRVGSVPGSVQEQVREKLGGTGEVARAHSATEELRQSRADRALKTSRAWPSLRSGFVL